MKIMSVVGARPNFMKVAPILKALEERAKGPAGGASGQEIKHVLVHTGQHYDSLMSESFFTDLKLPAPDINLSVGSGSHAWQTAEIMRRFEAVLLRERPDVLIVVGDVNSTLACALVAAKLGEGRPVIAHVEAGLRSFDREMPEEVNRVLTDHLADLLFVTEESALRNLAREGIPAEKTHFAGNTMIDSLLATQTAAERSAILDGLGLRKKTNENGAARAVCPYALLTLHRPSNVDQRDAFLNILDALREVSCERPVIFPVHPRTRQRIEELGLEEYFAPGEQSSDGVSPAAPGGIRMVEPLRYPDFLCLLEHAALVITDSGGIQEETTCLGVPCVTVRENTERPVTVEAGTNVIAGTTRQGIAAAIRAQLDAAPARRIPEKWDGKAARRIVDVLIRKFQERSAAAAHEHTQAYA